MSLRSGLDDGLKDATQRRRDSEENTSPVTSPVLCLFSVEFFCFPADWSFRVAQTMTLPRRRQAKPFSTQGAAQ